MRKKEEKPYYKVSGNFTQQVISGSTRRKENSLVFLIKKFKNHFLELLAYNCPINSLRIKFHRWRGVNIGKNVMIGLKVTLDHSYPEYIYIEDNVSLAGNNYILAHSNPFPHFKDVMPSYVAPVILKKGCWIGIGTFILPDITIGEYSVVATGSVVTKNVPSNVLVAGVPAKVIKQLEIKVKL